MSENPSVLTCSDGETLSVRRLENGDETRLQHFHDNLSPHSQSRFTPHGYDHELLQRYVRRALAGKDRSYILLNDTGTVIAYFFLWDFSTAVPALGIGVADDYQGRKLGPQMVQMLIDDARAAGLDGIELTTLLDNERAFVLYQSMGFTYLGDVDNIAGDGRVITERMMFLALKENATPSSHDFRPPI